MVLWLTLGRFYLSDSEKRVLSDRKTQLALPGFLMSGEPIRAGDTIYQSEMSIRNPSTYGSYGAGFGDTITDVDREFLAQREPISRFFVYYMAGDVFKNWFELKKERKEWGFGVDN